MRYLITGGAGFIGSHLADSLARDGQDVTLLDNVSTGSLENIRHLVDSGRARLEIGTILDEPLVHRLVREHDIVVHLAASVGVKLIIERPLETLMNNIRGTEVVLEACADADTKVLVTSTSEIYGKSADGPLNEESDRILGSPFKARWSYSTGKAVDEILAYTYHQERGTETLVVRLFNCVGPRQTGDYGMVLPTFVRQAIARQPITVYGDGEQRRCFCHVSDAVAALRALLEEPSAVGEVFNVGATHEVTIRELAEMVVDRTDSDSEIVTIPYDDAYEKGFEDMQRRVPDIRKLTGVTGWEPSRTLDEILDDVITYESARAS